MERTIAPVAERDLDELVPMMVAYCRFYEVDPGEDRLRRLASELLSSPAEGVQLIARGPGGSPVGFATVFWTWQTLTASRIGVMNDLFVIPTARGAGHADALIEACIGLCRDHRADTLCWQTALDNRRAQAVYERVGASSERWLDYSLAVEQQ